MKTFVKEQVFVDVILPNYNKAEFLEEAINSVISQSYKNWKLLIIDDGSEDSSKQVIENYKKNTNINVIYLSRNKGVAFCRNLGIRLSNSKYIAFIDSDDYWTQNKLEEQIYFMEKFNYGFTFTNYIPFYLKKEKKIFKKPIISPNNFNYDQFIHNTSIGMSSVILKRSALGKVKFKNIKICEDYFFKCQILKKDNLAKNLNKNMMFYRISKNSKQSNKLRNLYWVWYINRNYNRLSLFNNLKSLLFIIISSIKRYGIK